MAPEPDRQEPPARTSEWGAALALLPIAATFGYYTLPAPLQAQTPIQFMPQLLAYGAVGLWAARNSGIGPHLGLTAEGIGNGFRLGLATGLLLGCVNTVTILSVFPFLGYDVAFLKDTPHARLPVLVMVPWFICAIAVFVELNFRGFLLGRLAALEAPRWKSPRFQRWPPVALLASALTFTFDPFMVNTFRHLHWIALWDGLIWGALWLRTRNLWITIVAHAVEVIVMYLAVRMAFAIE
jgi:membrane protease YdiL (CAAX protease family)